ncbi:DUF3106 domain-containing protein [Comamonas sp. NoAH]|uniref:DUF3106 domain-containing protein n=1 Tax=Comamonas halotolerans TaxID=3041496 RepID=UPI0024E19182|nr:DUF3106 domain-containing protein [Comamonas sp. NoAH]
MPLIADTPKTSRATIFATAVAGVLLLGLAFGGLWSMNQVAMVPSAVPAYMAVEGDSERSSLSSNTHAPQLRLSSSGPIWREITEAQRQVLMPLRDRWDSMGALAKRRWLVLADRYPQMDTTERNKLLSRMNTWASLSAQQRNQARLNFESSRRLSAQELQTKWDEYQALSEAEKKRLAEQARKAKTAKKAKRRLAVVPPPKPPKPKVEQLEPTAPAVMVKPPVEAIPVETPQAMPSVHLPPLPHPPAVSSQPIAVPQSMPRVDLPPLPADEP